MGGSDLSKWIGNRERSTLRFPKWPFSKLENTERTTERLKSSANPYHHLTLNLISSLSGASCRLLPPLDWTYPSLVRSLSRVWCLDVGRAKCVGCMPWSKKDKDVTLFSALLTKWFPILAAAAPLGLDSWLNLRPLWTLAAVLSDRLLPKSKS